MRTNNERWLDDPSDEADFRQLLAQFGEPVQVEPPPDLVVRTARRLPRHTPQSLVRRQRFGVALRLGMGLLVLALVVLGLLSQYNGPSTVPFGTGAVGLGRIVLISQLALKPLLATISSMSMLLISLGLSAILGSMLVLRLTAQSHKPIPSRRG